MNSKAAPVSGEYAREMLERVICLHRLPDDLVTKLRAAANKNEWEEVDKLLVQAERYFMS